MADSHNSKVADSCDEKLQADTSQEVEAEVLEPDDVEVDEDDTSQADEEAKENNESPGAEEAPGDSSEALKAQLKAANDKYLRLQAEWDNYRKRTTSERAAERSRANERLVTNILPVVDDLQRAIEHGENSQGKSLLEGIKAVSSKLEDVLKREGLKAVDPKNGDAFNIDLHQAVSTEEDETVPKETVKQVFQKGYLMGDKVIRPAMVVVSTGGPERTKSEGD